MKNKEWSKYLLGQIKIFIVGTILLIIALAYFDSKGQCIILIPKFSSDISQTCGVMSDIFVNFLVLDAVFAFILFISSIPRTHKQHIEGPKEVKAKKILSRVLGWMVYAILAIIVLSIIFVIFLIKRYY